MPQTGQSGSTPPGGTSPGGPAPTEADHCLLLDQFLGRLPAAPPVTTLLDHFLELDMLPHTVSYAQVNGRDKYGAPTFATPTDYRARVIWRARRIIDKANGNESVSAGEVWVNAVLDSIKLDDRITLPDGTVPVIMNWHIISDENDCRYTKIFFGTGGRG